jgi:hypothetical protein
MGSVTGGRWQGAQKYTITLAVAGVRKMDWIVHEKTRKSNGWIFRGDSLAVDFP